MKILSRRLKKREKEEKKGRKWGNDAALYRCQKNFEREAVNTSKSDVSTVERSRPTRNSWPYLNAPPTPIHVTSTEIMVYKQCCSRQKQTRPFETCFAAVAQLLLYVYRATLLTISFKKKKFLPTRRIKYHEVHPVVNTCAKSILEYL